MGSENHTNIHGCAIVLDRCGLLICGPSGSGKSTLCQRLIDTWQSIGKFAAWIGDDRIYIETLHCTHIAHTTPQIAGLAEQRFLGIVEVDHQSSCVLDLEICLIPHANLERLPDGQTSQQHENLTSINVPERNTELAVQLVIEHMKQI